MKNLTNHVFPGLLIIGGAVLLVMGAQQGQNTWVLLGAGLALAVGVIILLLQTGHISRKVGTIIGALCAVGALGLGYRDYRSVKEVLEFNALKRAVDRQVIQGLKDIRTAQLGYRQANGTFTGDLSALQEFVRNGTIPMVRAIGQIPDTLTEEEGIQLGIILTKLPDSISVKQAIRRGLIVRDTAMVPALDSLFRTQKALEGRVYPFDPNTFTHSPVKKELPFLLKAGVVTSSGRNVPVFVAKDPAPLVPGDTLMVGSLEKATTSGNWTGE